MKTFRPLAAALFILALGHPAPAQESSEVASLRAKAERGNGIAQYNLGLAYVDGKGVARDPIEAFVWLSLARENGARGRALDNVAATLDKAALDAARQRIAERKVALGMTPATKSTAAVAAADTKPTAPAGNAPAAPEGGEDPSVARLRKERDTYSTRVGEMAADLFTVRTERDRLAEQAAETQKNSQAANAAALGLQEQLRAATTRATELENSNTAAKAELARAKQELAALANAPKPAPDNAALEAKTRELAAALTELEAARNFGRQVEDTLNKVNDDRARVAAGAAAELEAARQFGQQVEATLNKVTDQKAALEQQLATVTQAKAAAEHALVAKPDGPNYPDLRNQVAELETKLASTEKALAAKPAAPAYPDLSGRVADLETQFASAQTAARARAEELARANTKLAGDETAFAKINRELADTKSELVQARQALAATPAAPKYPDLSGKVAELEKQLAAKPAAPSYPDLSGQVAELESALASARNAAPAYPDLRANVSSLETRLAALSSENARTRQDLAGREALVQQLAQEVKRGEAGLQQAEESYNTLLAEAKPLRQRPAAPAYPDLSGRVAELENQLAAKPAAPAHPDLSARVAELEAAVTNSIRKFGAAEQARAEITRQFDEYKSATAAAQRERTTLLSNLKMLESDKAALRRQVEAATGESNQLRTQVATLKAQAAAPKVTAPAYPDLSGRVAELVAALAAQPAAPSYPDLSNRVRELENQLTRANTELSAFGPAKADLSTRVSELESALASASQNASAQTSALGAERDAARTALGELRESVARLEREKARLAAAATPVYPDLRDRVNQLEADLAAKPAAPTYPDLSSRVSELESALAAAQLAVAAKPAAPAYPDLSGRVAELESALTAARNAAPAYPDLSSRVNELGSEVAQLRADRERMQKLLADSGRQLAEVTAASRSRPVAPPGYLERVRELESALAQARAAAVPAAAPAYPDLSGRVGELEAAAADSVRRLIAAEAAQTALQQQLAEATQLRRERDELSGKVADLTGEVAQLRTDRERMVKMLADAGRQMRDTSADSVRVKELESQLAVLGSEAARAKQEIAALNLAREAAQAQAGGFASERDAARLTQNELRGTLARLEREKAEIASARPIQAGAPAYADLSGRVRELEERLAAAPRGPAAPSYPDLSSRVGELEAALAGAKQQLAAGSSAPAAAPGDTSGLEQKLADTESRLATALRGYATLQRERDTLAENAGKSAAATTAERDALASQVASLTGQVEQLRASAQSSSGGTQAELARLNESVATLQRTSTQAARDAAAARALAQQLQGANSVLAGENYQLKTMLARTTGGPAPATVPVTAPALRTHVVAAGDSLSRLSQRYYGTPGRWQEIYNANATLLGPNGVLRVGAELRIP